MGRRISIDETILDYLSANSVRKNDILDEVRAFTAHDPSSRMQVTPETGVLLSILTRAAGVKKALEVGVFTGYSSICIAQSMPHNGLLYAIDSNEEWTTHAKRFWEKANITDKIKFILADGVEAMSSLLPKHTGTFDLVFIDADKKNYKNYYEFALQLLHANGLLVIDNVLWRGLVANESSGSAAAKELREFNRALHADDRIMLTILPVGDGVTVALKN